MFRVNYYWENHPSSASESEDEQEEEFLVIERRQYKMSPRVGLEKWDDNDFIYRFRISKRTTMLLLDLIKNCLVCTETRYGTNFLML